MYDNTLRRTKIDTEKIYLDPNNPRFWTEATLTAIPDSKVSDEKVQARARERISKHGVDQLIDSILRNGFLQIDSIVVRELEESDGEYVVVEGNRRLAALKTVRERIEDQVAVEEGLNEADLHRLKASTDKIEVLVYTGENTEDIAWIFQGIRHVSGIREWEPAQKGKLVATQIEEQGLKFREAGQRFGLTAHAVGRYYRTYKALQQMRGNEEFGPKARNQYFTLFEEAIRNKSVKNWLGWNDDEYRFEAFENLEQFYSWITPDEENEDKRRIHDPRQIKGLAFLIAEGHEGLLSQIDQFEITIDGAWEQAKQLGVLHDWRKALDNASKIIREIPKSAISEDPEALVERLRSLLQELEELKKMATALISEE